MKTRDLLDEIKNVRRTLADESLDPADRLLAADFLLAGLQRLIVARAEARAADRAVSRTLAAYVERKEAGRD